MSIRKTALILYILCASWNSNEYCDIIFSHILIFNKYVHKNGYVYVCVFEV